MRGGLSIGVLLLALSPASALAAQSSDTLTVDLAEAERRALVFSPLLPGAEAQIKVSQAQEDRVRKARFLPELNLRNSWGVLPRQRGAFNDYGVLVSPDTLFGVNDLSWFTQVDLRLVQPIFTFGKIGRRISAAEYAVEASEAGLEKTQADVVLMVRQLYWGVVLAQELQDVVNSIVSRVDEADARLQEQYDEGVATQNDLFKFQLFRYEVNRRVREVEGGLEQARAGLRAAMGLHEDVTVQVATTDLEPLEVTLNDLESYLDLARRYRPELRQLQAGISARRSLMVAEQRDAWPTLFFGGSVSANVAPARYDPKNPFWQNQTNYFRGGGVLGFEWNLNFAQHKAEANVQRSEVGALESQTDALTALVEREVREAHVKASRAQADVEEGRTALQASESWLRAEIQTYDIGISEIKDLIDAFRANAELRALQLKNIADFNIALAELSRRTGVDLAGAGQ